MHARRNIASLPKSRSDLKLQTYIDSSLVGRCSTHVYSGNACIKKFSIIRRTRWFASTSLARACLTDIHQAVRVDVFVFCAGLSTFRPVLYLRSQEPSWTLADWAFQALR